MASEKQQPAASDPHHSSPPSSGTSSPRPPKPQHTQSTSSYFTYPVAHVMSGLYRRLTEPVPEPSSARPPRDPMSASGVFTPPRRTASPFQPPPLTPLTLKTSPPTSHQLLTRSLAEEIRLLVPPRLQLLDTWQLAYSLERDGSSLSTLYEKCKEYSQRSPRASYVLVVKDAASADGAPGEGHGSVFGAYLSDPPHPSSHYYGTGECFLWRASTLPGTPMVHVSSNGNTATNGSHAKEGNDGLHPHEALKIAGLPPPPSADTTETLGRNTTFRGEETDENAGGMKEECPNMVHESTASWRDGSLQSSRASSVSSGAGSMKANHTLKAGESRSGASTPDRIRFKAFPYSGVNDYMIFCETGFLSVGGGDGHYGLWLDGSFEKGVSSPCLTFGNEILSDDGSKFDIIGVEVWYVGS